MVPLNEVTRVLVVDDSALVRQIISTILSRDPTIEVVGVARDGVTALAAVEKLAPDVVTLDVEMPGMSGLEVLTRLRGKALSVIVIASTVEASCDLTVQALTLGAFDFVPKPTAEGIAALAAELTAKVKAAGVHRKRLAPTAGSPRPPAIERPRTLRPGARSSAMPSPRTSSAGDLIAIGASTGGPEALTAVLAAMPADSPPILVVQHMPSTFTAKFAQRLDGRLAVRVKEAVDGDKLRRGLVLLAPGTMKHMVLRREGHELVVRLIDTAPVMHHRPSVDVLFASCAEVVGRRAVGAILTGMGQDGARGLVSMRETGSVTIAQNEATCVVFGMPMEAIALGGAAHVLPLDEIGPALVRLVKPAALRTG